MKMLFLLSLILFSSCTSKIKEGFKDAKYSAYEMIGYEKRDLFRKEVKSVKNNQEDSQEAFEDALEKLQHFYAYDGGKLEREYNKLKKAYENSLEESHDLSQSIQNLDNVAKDLFTEWKKEIKEITNSDLRKKSSKKLRETQVKYGDLYKALKNSEKRISPLLVKINDQVLYLKHNLNAGAIEGLKTEGDRIQKDIESLINEMKEANKKADEFIKTL
ncbi:MAG: DUF2959 family protein [Bacteriovoracaceae bacterium]